MKPAPVSSFKLSYGLFAFFLVVANLRPALTSVGPLLETIRTSLGLSHAVVGLLPTLPLLIFSGLSLLARFGEAFGIEKTLAWCLALIAAGIALRSEGSIAARCSVNRGDTGCAMETCATQPLPKNELSRR